MIEIGYNFLKKDLDKIQKFKNPTLDINKNKLNKNSKYKIFLNKTQFNNLLEKRFIKYKLTDSKKKQNILVGDGIGSLLSMAFNMIKPALPKIATTIGLSGLSAGVSHGINKALNRKKKILEIDEKMMNQIKQNLKKINDSKVFDRKVTLNQYSGILSFLLPMLASTIIPSLISGKEVSKNRNFFEIKSKYPSLFERKNYPLSNIFINNLLKILKILKDVILKTKFLLLKIISLLYLIYKIVIKKVVIGYLYLEKMMIFSSLIHLVLAIFQLIYIKITKIIILLQIYIEFKI